MPSHFLVILPICKNVINTCPLLKSPYQYSTFHGVPQLALNKTDKVTGKVTQHSWRACHVPLTEVFMVLQYLILVPGEKGLKTVHCQNGQIYLRVAFFPRWTHIFLSGSCTAALGSRGIPKLPAEGKQVCTCRAPCYPVLGTAVAQIPTCWSSISPALLKVQCAQCNCYLKVTCILVFSPSH